MLVLLPSCYTQLACLRAAFCGCAQTVHGPHCLFVPGLHISKETMAAIRQLAHQLLRLNPVMKCPVTCDAPCTSFTRLASYQLTVLEDDCGPHAGLL